MKNFPHQFAVPSRFVDALAATQGFLAAGGDLATTWNFGEWLVRAGVKNLMGEGSVDELLEADKQKPVGRQGTQAAARDTRRTLRLLGYLSNALELTPSGIQLLEAQSDEARRILLRDALLALRLGDPPAQSHPYRILLRLLGDHPGMPRANTLLALEAADDSEEEYARISSLAPRPPPEVEEELGLTPASAANSVKILPSLAASLGDLRKVGPLAYPTGYEPASLQLEDEQAADAQLKTTHSSGQLGAPLAPDDIAPNPEFGDQNEVFVDMAAAIALRKKRTIEHQALMRHFASKLAECGYTLYANPYDCLANLGEEWLLVEAKTLNGSPIDSRRQSEKALGQLMAYSFFDIPPDIDSDALNHIALFSQRPPDNVSGFLANNGVRVVWPDGMDWKESNGGGVGNFAP